MEPAVLGVLARSEVDLSKIKGRTISLVVRLLVQISRPFGVVSPSGHNEVVKKPQMKRQGARTSRLGEIRNVDSESGVKILKGLLVVKLFLESCFVDVVVNVSYFEGKYHQFMIGSSCFGVFLGVVGKGE
jgi:hypothetical protein